jgi:hypothetical protein
MRGVILTFASPVNNLKLAAITYFGSVLLKRKGVFSLKKNITQIQTFRKGFFY